MAQNIATLKKTRLPFDKVSHWEMLLDGDLFGRYQTKADAVADAKHYGFQITHINGRKVR